MASTADHQQALALPAGAPGVEGRLVVERNPDDEASPAYLPRVPVGAGLVLKAAEPWPVSSRVYCHPLDEPGPSVVLEVLEEVGVRMCAWRGGGGGGVARRGPPPPTP